MFVLDAEIVDCFDFVEVDFVEVEFVEADFAVNGNSEGEGGDAKGDVDEMGDGNTKCDGTEKGDDDAKGTKFFDPLQVGEATND